MRRPVFYNSLMLDDSVVTYRNHGFTDICSLLFFYIKGNRQRHLKGKIEVSTGGES